MKHYYTNDFEFKLLERKGIFPYSYIDSYEKLKERKLPQKKYFFNNIKKCGISDEEYEHTKIVWKFFNCKTLGEYQDVYNKCDILLLADDFENFRSSMLQYYDKIK